MSVSSGGTLAGLHDRLGRFVFGYRDWLAPLCGMLLLGFSTPRPLFGDPRLDGTRLSFGIDQAGKIATASAVLQPGVAPIVFTRKP